MTADTLETARLLLAPPVLGDFEDSARMWGDADVTRCRQVVRDWTLRESRMLVDEQGRPLR